MTRILLGIVLIAASLFAKEVSAAKLVKLSSKGEKIVQTLCERKKLPASEGTIEELIQKIKASKACPPLSQNKLKAVAYYVSHGSVKVEAKHIEVPSNAKCPVCGMFVSKYPKWVATMERDGKVYYFDGVKDMMKYVIFDGDFVFDRKKIRKMTVSDYYTLEEIPAKEAFYVLDSDVFGPMGRELIPFKSQKSAKDFMHDHNGKAMLQFPEISDTILMRLDGLE